MPSRTARRLLAAVALLAGACGGAASSGPDAGTAPPAAAPLEPEPAEGLLGTWYLLLPDLPFAGLRLQVRQADGQRLASWISFDWSASEGPEDLAGRSKPVAVTLTGDIAALVIEGPAPMLTEANEPNGQRGAWRFDLRAPPDGAQRLAGVAVHRELTGPQGTAAVMTREFRPKSN